MLANVLGKVLKNKLRGVGSGGGERWGVGMFLARRVVTLSPKIELDCSFHTALRMFHDPLTCLCLSGSWFLFLCLFLFYSVPPF